MPGLFGMYPRPGFRRGSDTRNMLDTLRAMVFLPRSTPEKDAIALMRGERFVVTGVRRTPAGWRFGYLYMSPAPRADIWWESRHGDVAHVMPPVELRLVRRSKGRERVKPLLFRIMVFADSTGEWELGVPTGDVALVTVALAELTKQQGRPRET